MRYALVTPSYAPDFERCRLLCESVERFVEPGVRHYVIVDRRDERLFQQLAGPSTEIMTVESLLPWWIFRVPMLKSGWFSLRTPPIRNWMLQQLVKLAAVRAIDADVLAFADSDVTFVRPFSMSRFEREERTCLVRVDFQSEGHARWLRNARRLLGVEGPIPQVNYVGNFVIWRRDNVLQLHRHLERVSGRHWISAICRYWHFSEYMLYGVFVEHVLGLEAAKHYGSDEPILHLSWRYDLASERGVEQFLDGLRPEHIGIMIHSKNTIPIERYRPRIEELWEQNKADRARPPVRS